MIEKLLGQDDPGRIPDLGDFEGGVHTEVITECVRYGEMRRI